MPGDILLVEGGQRISIAIKYLTQSTWSHAAIYIGDSIEPECSPDQRCLVEADVIGGVIAVPLSKYASFNTRICRPINLLPEDRQKLLDYILHRMGQKYDMKAAVDLVRYLLPQPPVPARWRRKMLALGSSDPTRAICSTLIALAFQSIGFPILPDPAILAAEGQAAKGTLSEIQHIHRTSLFAPRDFDLSPYFQIIKPLPQTGFDYKSIHWED